MAIRLTTSFVNTVRPGAYVNPRVRSFSSGVASTGVIAIIGEADRGEHFSNEVLADNAFGPDQVAQIIAKYGAGSIVDAASALAAPSNDPDIQGAPNSIIILKTNAGTKASKVMATSFGSLSAQNFGAYGNQLAYQVEQTQAEVAPTLTSDTIDALTDDPTLLNGLSFSVRVNGGAATVVTLSATTTDHDTIAELVAEIDAALPAGIACTAGTGDTLVFTVDADASAHQKGWAKSFELIDSTPGDLAILAVAAGLVSSAAEPAVEVTVTDTATQDQESFSVPSDVVFTMGYAGTTATATLNAAGLLTTTVVGGSGSNLSIDTKQFATIKALADYVSAQTGYSASVSSQFSSQPVASLDRFAAIGIASPAARPGRVKRALQAFKQAMSTSSYVDFTATATAGLPDAAASLQFLSGGAKGATTSASVVDALAKLEGVRVNLVVPLFSRDASEDIASEETDAGSTYTIDAIHAATKSSMLKMSTPKLKKHRSAVLSFKGAFADAKQKAGGLASFRCSLAIQDAQVGATQYQPWYLACIAAGMQAAGFYKAIFNKLMNVTSVVDPSGFDSGSPSDVEEALESSLLIAENSPAGTLFVSDQTTYGIDDNFVYNSIQAVYAADIITVDLADFIGRRFVGQSLADVEQATVASAMSERMDLYKRLKLIVGSDDAPLGYTNISVEIQGPVIYIGVEIKLATAIYFLPINLEISQVQSAA